MGRKLMRIGLIADIHGNWVALEMVLAELTRERVDQIVCLGDVAVLGPEPAAVMARLRELGCPVVMGNTDAWLLDGSPAGDDPDSRRMAALTIWCRDRLGVADLAAVRSFQPTVTVALDAARQLLCCHGSPRSFDDVIAATTPDAEVADMLAGHSAAILAGGHTHVQLLRRQGELQIVNAGSVGLPGVGPGGPRLSVNRQVRWAEYAVLEVGWAQQRIELRRVPLDVATMREALRRSGMPEAEWWLGKWADDAG
jgi:predicted phosphodiesterase